MEKKVTVSLDRNDVVCLLDAVKSYLRPHLESRERLIAVLEDALTRYDLADALIADLGWLHDLREQAHGDGDV